MAIHRYKTDPNCKQNCITCRACVQLPFDIYGIDASIDTKRLKNNHYILVHSKALDNGRDPDIGTLKEDRGDTFSECCTESFITNFLCYVNEFLFEMVKTAFKGYIHGINNSHSTEKMRSLYAGKCIMI